MSSPPLNGSSAEPPDGTATDAETSRDPAQQADAAEWENRWRRAAAELDNFRKRDARDVAREREGERARVASAFLPVIDSLPIVLSAGPYGRLGKGGYGIEPGIATSLFWGSRSYNFNANYVMTFGLLGQFRAGFGPSKETTIIVAAQVDLAFLSLPIVYLVEAAKGGSRETDRVPGKGSTPTRRCA